LRHLPDARPRAEGIGDLLIARRPTREAAVVAPEGPRWPKLTLAFQRTGFTATLSDGTRLAERELNLTGPSSCLQVVLEDLSRLAWMAPLFGPEPGRAEVGSVVGSALQNARGILGEQLFETVFSEGRLRDGTGAPAGQRHRSALRALPGSGPRRRQGHQPALGASEDPG
jgi:hypothetical protein